MQARAHTPELTPEVVSLAMLKLLKAHHTCSFGFIHIKDSQNRVTMEVRVLQPFSEQSKGWKDVGYLSVINACVG